MDAIFITSWCLDGIYLLPPSVASMLCIFSLVILFVEARYSELSAIIILGGTNSRRMCVCVCVCVALSLSLYDCNGVYMLWRMLIINNYNMWRDGITIKVGQGLIEQGKYTKEWRNKIY